MTTANVTIVGITHFMRENFHTPRQVFESFDCVDMLTDSGERLRNFTRSGSEFSAVVSKGESFLMTYTVKEAGRVCPETGVTYTAVTYCVKGVTKAAQAAEKKEAKKLARLQKLGLA
jgi:hypothetical protein